VLAHVGLRGGTSRPASLFTNKFVRNALAYYFVVQIATIEKVLYEIYHFLLSFYWERKILVADRWIERDSVCIIRTGWDGMGGGVIYRGRGC
jgi:hypothetical protein